jgi:Ser-tRNA(Ala) deacylase AlaX
VARQGRRVTAVVERAEALDARPELVRTLTVRPPVVPGTVRIVEIEGFDAQACGGTHVHSTLEIGEARVTKFENRGRHNKRFYWDLEGRRPSPSTFESRRSPAPATLARRTVDGRVGR